MDRTIRTRIEDGARRPAAPAARDMAPTAGSGIGWPRAAGLAILTGGLLLLSQAGCQDGSSRTTGPTRIDAAAVRTSGQAVQDPFLVDHNSRFLGGRTFRWVPPVQIHVLTGDPAQDSQILAQFTAWEQAIGGAAGSPFYDPRPMPEALPDRGIFFWVTPLPAPVVGFAEPFAPLEQARRQSSLALDLQRRAVRSAAVRRLEIPEVTTGGEVFRCAILLDPNAFSSGLLSERELMWLIRHETGHCLGFVGHVPRGVMTAVINGLGASMTITPDVRGMMQRLYRLAPGTEVVP